MGYRFRSGDNAAAEERHHNIRVASIEPVRDDTVKDDTVKEETMDITTPTELTLTAVNAPSSGGCGCGGCGCGDASARAEAPAATEAPVATEEPAASGAVVSEDYLVTGMTCGHCVSSVTEELSALAGVDSVSVDLAAGGTSIVTVQSAAALDAEAVRAAIDEAGYTLVNSTP